MCIIPMLILFYLFLIFFHLFVFCAEQRLRATIKTNISSRLGSQRMKKLSKYILFNFIIYL